jgi:hypothetical protein
MTSGATWPRQVLFHLNLGLPYLTKRSQRLRACSVYAPLRISRVKPPARGFGRACA